MRTIQNSGTRVRNAYTWCQVPEEERLGSAAIERKQTGCNYRAARPCSISVMMLLAAAAGFFICLLFLLDLLRHRAPQVEEEDDEEENQQQIKKKEVSDVLS